MYGEARNKQVILTGRNKMIHDSNDTEAKRGLYGSYIRKNRAVGYCHYHKATLSVRALRRHECLKKQCRKLERYEEHDFWRQQAQKRERRRAKKKAKASWEN